MDSLDPTAEKQLIEAAAQWEARAQTALAAWQQVETDYRSAYDQAVRREIDKPTFDQAKATYETRQGQYQRFQAEHDAFYAAHPGLREQVQAFYRGGPQTPVPPATGSVGGSYVAAAPPIDEDVAEPRPARRSSLAPQQIEPAVQVESSRPVYNDYEEPAPEPKPKAKREREVRERGTGPLAALPRPLRIGLIAFASFFVLIMLMALILPHVIHRQAQAPSAHTSTTATTAAAASLDFDQQTFATAAGLKATTAPAGYDTTRLADAPGSTFDAYADATEQTFLIASGTFSSASAAQKVADDSTHDASGDPAPFDERRIDGDAGQVDSSCAAELLRAGATVVVVTPASPVCKTTGATAEQLAPVDTLKAKIVDAVAAQVKAS